MKKIFLVAALAFAFASCENTTSNSGSNTNDSLDNTTDHAAGSAYTPGEGDVRYNGGEVQVWRNSNWERTNEDVTLDDGITVRSNGRAVRNGEEVELEDGVVVTKTGRFFDKAGNVIEDGWDGVKKGFKNAKEEVKDVFKDDNKKTDN